MSLDIIVNLLKILVKLHLHGVIVDNKLIDIRSNLFYLVNCQDKTVSGHEDKAVRKLLSGILMSLHDLGIKKWLIVSVQCQMSLVSPICQLVDNALVEIIINLGKRSLLSMYISCAESTGRVTSVDSLDIYNIRHRNFLGIKEVVAICLL